MSQRKPQNILRLSLEEQTQGTGRMIMETVITVVMAFVLALIIRTYAVEATVIPSGSMIPTIEIQDRLLVNKLAYDFEKPKRGDIIVFQPPVNTTGPPFVKRIIGLPGDVVEVRNGKVYITGESLKEDYIAEAPSYNFGPVQVPPGCLFVMGDNRNSSYDSHLWNAWLHIDKVQGKAFWRYWPLDRFGSIH